MIRSLTIAVVLLLSVHAASGYTEICVAPAPGYRASKDIRVPPEKFVSFVTALNSFAKQEHYLIGPKSLSPPPGTIDVLMSKAGTAEAVTISNRGHRDVVSATMAECGTQGFLPYWHEFLGFVHAYENSK